MKIERVTARAFGPLTGETLMLARGMTVIAGPNEAGKSTWHAALKAAVCGVRRGRGASTKSDVDFASRHRPWDQPERWEVEARLRLDDGREIEINQDLAGKVACHAIDVGLGRDVSDEIMDGTPDASRWLGLDRDAFAATICVNQAQILAIADRDTAATLQEHMQRAAATRGTDATAAEARDRLVAYRRDEIGVDRIGARGPLRAARNRLESSRAALEEARRRHDEYLAASAEAEAAEREASDDSRRIAVIEAALARRVADSAGQRAARAEELERRHPAPPAGSAARDELADAVASAIDRWERRPRPQPLTGPTSAEMERDLASLPATPVGDTQVHAGVSRAQRELEIADEALHLLGPRPVVDDPAPPAALDESSLRVLARRLRTPVPEPVDDLEARLAAAPSALSDPPAMSRGLGLLAGFALGALAAIVLVLGEAIPAVALVLAGLAVLGWSWLRGRTDEDATLRVARAEAALAPLRAAEAHARRERAEAAAEADAAGLPADPAVLESIADERAAADRRRAATAAWDRQRGELDARHATAAAEVRRALDEREVPAHDGFAEYEAACRMRAQQATLAGGRDGLARAVEARRAAEAGIAQAQRAVEGAEESLRLAASAAGINATDAAPDRVVAALRAWRAARADEQRRADDALAEWQELVALLDGRSVEALRAEASERAARAEHLLAALDDVSELGAFGARDDLEMLLSVEREEHARVQREADSRAGAMNQMRQELPDVAEAEEQLADAEVEAERVNDLAGVIDETLRLLRAAEEQVHRDLAPILADAVRRWLPVVSDGAYLDATVDPADLAVSVKEAATGRWRPALLLSEGTREQIYLLLRVAMAQHLVTTGETAPLLLDEVTAQADRRRAERLLGVLHGLSAERQVVLFTHDEEVAAWAQRHFGTDRDLLVQLPLGAVERSEALV